MQSLSFKQRVLNTIVSCAQDFKSVFLDFEYLIYSDKFSIEPYYIISSTATNYKHLTGVNSNIAPYEFFEMCLNGTITENDFDFAKLGQAESSVKGAVRQKIIALPLMSTLLLGKLTAEENYVQGRINCSLATTDNKITIGFENRTYARPKTLLKGNELNQSKIVDVTLVLRRNKGVDKFDRIIQGDIAEILSDIR